MQRCLWVDQWIEESVGCFFPDGQYQEIVLDQDVPKAACYVIYFPSYESKDLERLLLKAAESLSADGLLILVDAFDDHWGNQMCHQADGYQALLKMRCIVNQQPYQGELSFFKDKSIVMFQFWKSGFAVDLAQWVVY